MWVPLKFWKETEGVSNAKQLVGSVLADALLQTDSVAHAEHFLVVTCTWQGTLCLLQFDVLMEVTVSRLSEALNLAPLLLTAPHPHGALAAESVRGSGGFEFRWPAGRSSGNLIFFRSLQPRMSGCYDLDWGLPFFRLGILVPPAESAAIVLVCRNLLPGTLAAGLCSRGFFWLCVAHFTTPGSTSAARAAAAGRWVVDP